MGFCSPSSDVVFNSPAKHGRVFGLHLKGESLTRSLLLVGASKGRKWGWCPTAIWSTTASSSTCRPECDIRPTGTIVAVPYVGNEPRPRFPRRSVLRVVKVCARGSKTATIVFGHLSDQRGRNAKRWNENSSDRNRCTNHKSRNCYSRMQSTRDIKMCSTSACHLRVICRLSVADRGLRQSFHNGTPWLPWSLLTL